MQSGQLAYDAGCMSVRRSRQIRDELDVKRDLTRSLAAAASVCDSRLYGSSCFFGFSFLPQTHGIPILERAAEAEEQEMEGRL
jgi:hypothetical protein